MHSWMQCISGRPFVHESVQIRPTARHGHGTVPPQEFRFVINFEKSCFTPTQVLEFLVNTRDMTLH